MVCESVSGKSESRSNVAIIPMDNNLIKSCDKLKYRVNKFYNSNPSSFFGVCAVCNDDEICGYVCGQETRYSVHGIDKKILVFT